MRYQLSPQASDVISLNHGVFRDLKLKTIVEVLRIRRPEVWVNHEGECWPQGVNLAEWLTSTLAGTLTVDTLLESQPTS